MSDPEPPPPPKMTMIRPVAVTNVGAADVVVVNPAGDDTTLKPGQSVDGGASKPADAE